MCACIHLPEKRRGHHRSSLSQISNDGRRYRVAVITWGKKKTVDPPVEGYFCTAVLRSYRSQWNRYSLHLVVFVILLWSLHTFFYLLLFNA